MKRAKDKRRASRILLRNKFRAILDDMATAFYEHICEPKQQFRAMAAALRSSVTKIAAEQIAKKVVAGIAREMRQPFL